MDKEIKINFNEAPKEKVVIELREGEALQLKDNSKSFSSNGVITNPADYIEKNLSSIDATKCIVVYSVKNHELKFIDDRNNKEATEITGKLLSPEYLEELGINSSTKWSPKDLAIMLKKWRFLFVDEAEFTSVFTSLRQFTAKIETFLEDKDSQRGETKKLLEKRVDADIPNDFKLKTPIYIGEDEVVVMVNICFEATSQSVQFYLESVEIMQQEHIQSEIVLKREIERVPDKYTVLQVS